MFDKFRLKDVLVRYKQDFAPDHWSREKYKWEAVRCFQDHWDVRAADFAGMLARSLSKTYNLLASMNNFPARMITGFARTAPEEVRSMFLALFDESGDVYERMDAFKMRASILLEKYGSGAGQHYQYENAISTYLWLRYPDKYYIYKFSEVKAVSDALESDYRFRKGAFADNIRNFYQFYNEICRELAQDAALVALLQSQLTDTCYPDPALRTLTVDVGFYISRSDTPKSAAAESPAAGDPPLPAQEIPPRPEADPEPYTKDDFLREVYMSEAQYDRLTAVLRNKKNLILQGAPGVGKTFAARRLAHSMMGRRDDTRVELVQFHQSYSYEDFVMGYRPVRDGFALQSGIFYRFCQKAAAQPDRDFFFLIDEINRGNLSRIFGELLMLIERDYRGVEATLAYNGLPFSVPENLYLIGMMNTADRSLAMIDYALRRRFSFFEMAPGFDSDGFLRYQERLHSETLGELIDRVKELNREIARDPALGRGFCIGHSYFCGREECTDAWLREVVDYEILPMLSEYWFDDTARLQRWENILQGVFQ